MTKGQALTGRCLCGAVTITAVMAQPGLSVCHCDMCRRHTSSMFIGLAPDQDSLKIEGPAKSFRSTDWAERGFCETCGSTLWYGTVHDGARYLAAGLFENAGGSAPTVEYFSDKCPQGYRLQHDGKRLTKEETIAFFEGGGEPGA
jgi:hypothetical protein